MTLPLDGVRVVDLTRILAGPFATQRLGDLGAAVVHTNTSIVLGAQAVATAAGAAHVVHVREIYPGAGGPLVSAWQAAKLQRILKGDFSAQFALSLALKDVNLALATCHQ